MRSGFEAVVPNPKLKLMDQVSQWSAAAAPKRRSGAPRRRVVSGQWWVVL